MTNLRALVGACFLLAVMGIVVCVPLGWALVLVTAEKANLLNISTATAERLKALPGIGGAYIEEIIKGRPYQRKDALGQKEILPRAAYEGITYKLGAKHR